MAWVTWHVNGSSGLFLTRPSPPRKDRPATGGKAAGYRTVSARTGSAALYVTLLSTWGLSEFALR